MEFFHKPTNFPFMATRKVWYGLSVVFMIISFATLATRHLNLDLDFTGGVNISATFPGAANVEAVRTAMSKAGYPDPQVESFGTSRDVSIRLPPLGVKQDAQVIRTQVTKVLQGVDPAVTVQPPDVVGPQVGGELWRSAELALFFTLFLIFIYIAWRFHTWRLSLGAMLAVMHDPILVLGVFAILQTKFDLPAVAAILAVIGYSLNDTVVVFDRIRERFGVNRRLAPALVLDQSINQTLSRTIMTKVVTAIVVVALLVIGGPALRGFSEALLIGILAGTYSSIYISSAIALDCGLTSEHLFPTMKKTAVDAMP
ncbi:MAG TPA: protein translocase subunit SecF [Steroidobacteraceae bacterium]|nr:protein translocase subunit SecF [Steroidobacteraceae bacterium]